MDLNKLVLRVAQYFGRECRACRDFYKPENLEDLHALGYKRCPICHTDWTKIV